MLARLRRRLALVAAVLVGLILFAIAAFHLPAVRQRVLDYVQARVERESGVRLRAASLHYNLFTRSIELRDLSVTAVRSDAPFLQADRAVVILGPGIFLGRSSVDRISLVQPRLTLVRDADGTLNLPASQSDGQPASPIHLGIVSVSKGSARFDDRVSRRSLAFGPFDLSVDTAGPRGQPGAFGPGPFTLRAADVETSGTIAGRVSFDGTRVSVDQLRVDTREGRIDADGWTDVIGEQAAVSARVRATIDVAQAARLARVDVPDLTGRLDASVDVAGTLAAPAITIAVTSRDARYAPLGPIRLTGRSSISATDGNRARLDALDVESSAGSLHADGTIGSASRLAVRWANLHVDDLVRAFRQALPVRVGSLASGSGTIEFGWQDLETRAWSRLRGQAATTLKPVANVTDAALALSGTADLRLDRGAWSLRHSIGLSRARADAAGEVTGRLVDGAGDLRSTLGGRSRVQVADLGAVLPLIQAAGVRLPADVADGASGSLRATIDPGGTIANPSARIDAGLRGVRARVLPRAVDVDARLSVDATAVRALDLRAIAGTTVLQGTGVYPWRGPLDARVEVNTGDLSEIAGDFRVPVSVSGSARLEAALSGVAPAVQAKMTLSTRDLVVEQVPIGALAATAAGPLNLADGGMMHVEATAPALGARANVDVFNRTRYGVVGDVTVDHQDIGRLIPPRYREQIGDVSGRLEATVSGSAALSSPFEIRGRVAVEALDATWRGTRLALASPGSVIVAGDRIGFFDLDLRVGQGIRATLGGQIGANASEELRLHLDGPLSELIDVGSRASGAAPADVRGDGTVTLDAIVRGTLDHPQPNGTLTVRSPSLAYGTLPAVTDLVLHAAVDPTLIRLRTFTARWQGALIAGDGELPWRLVAGASPRLAAWMRALPPEPARARLTIRADNVTQAALNGLVAPERLREIQGNVSASIAVDADGLSLDAVRATAVLDRASLTLAGVAFTQSAPTRLALEKGRARIEDFRWSAEGNPIVASGGANLTTTPASLDVGLSGVLNLRALGVWLPDVRPGGRAETDFKITGTFDDPAVAGRIRISDGELQLDSPRIAASDLEGTIEVGAGRKASVALAGSINTGSAKITGTIDLADLDKPTGNLQLTGRNVALEYPPGLQTESNADLALALDGTRSRLTGRVDVLGGTYRQPLVLSSQLLNLSSTSGIASAAPSDDWMSRLALNVTIATVSDVRIDNNYGRLDAGATLRLTGTAATPGVLGHIEAADEGEIYLGGNTYKIERLAIDLANPRVITPEVTFSAQTRVGSTPIGIDLNCPAAGPCERKVTSLATGVDDKEAEAALLGTMGTTAEAGESLARLLSGELLGVVGRTVGLDALRLEQAAQRRDIFDDPTLISGDVDPAARLTLAKRVGSNVELVYSQNLADDGFTWSTSYFGRYGMSGRLLILDDQSRAYEFRHEPPLGGARTRRRTPAPAPRITAVKITGTPGFTEREVRRQLRLTGGDRFTFGAWQRDRDRLERFYHARDFLEARIRARRLQSQPGDESVELEYAIARGPRTELIVRGATLPDKVRDRLSSRWTSALFDGFLEKDARTIVREHLYRLGHLQAAVTVTVTTDASRDLKTLAIDVVPGPVVPWRVDVTGNSALTVEQLLEAIEKEDPLSAWLDPQPVERLLESRYRSEGFLAADVSVGTPQDRNGTSVVTIAVVEGAPYAIGAIDLSGLPREAESGSREDLGLSAGARYRPAGVAVGVDKLESRLRRAAYRRSSVDVDTRVDAQAARVDISIRVTPGPRSILRDVVVDGGDAGKPAVARSIVLETGAPLDVEALAETRRRLYDLDVYRSVDVNVQPVASSAPPAAAGAPLEEPVVARISLAERPRYRLRYGLAVNDEQIGTDERNQTLGFAADLENRNVLGRGFSAGLSLRLRQDQQVGRFTLGARRFFGLPIRSTVFVEREREQLNPEAAFPTISNISTLTAEQAYSIRSRTELRYGYGIDRNHTFIRSDDDNPFDVTVRIARFTTSGLVDRRNDPFNPVRGWFVSSTLELSKPGLGSDLSFLKDFAQYSHFVPIRKGLVFASAARLGLARTFDDEVLIPSERFYAGGANSVRGYREDDLGEPSALGGAEGGSALVVLNGELRFPVFKWVRGVGFIDAGNVYPKVGDISLRELQVGTGAGARLDTPVGLIRFDLAVPVNRRPEDPRWRFYFGLGHAF